MTTRDHVTPPRWRCLISPCSTRSRWQQATINDAADAAARRHYLVMHWERPE